MWLRPSIAFYGGFSLDADRSPGFGSARTDYTALLGLALAAAPRLKRLTLPVRATRRTVLQKVRGRTINGVPAACKHRVSGSLSLPSRGPFHLSFTVLCAIGHWVVFRLGGWSPLLPPGFLVSRRTPGLRSLKFASRTGLSPSPAGFPKAVPLALPRFLRAHTPAHVCAGLASSALARRY